MLFRSALYRCFIDKGLSKNEAKELVKEYSFYVAKKAHKLLKTFFHISGFFRIFRLFMKKGMSGDEIWKSRILSDDKKYYRVDVLKCLWADTCKFFECPELCEIFCLCDHIVMSILHFPYYIITFSHMFSACSPIFESIFS